MSLQALRGTDLQVLFGAVLQTWKKSIFIYSDDKDFTSGMRGFHYFTWRDLLEQSVCGTDRHFCSGTIVQDCLSLHSCLLTSFTGIWNSFQTWISKLIFEISWKRIQNGPCLTLLPGNIYTGGPRDLLTLRPRHLKIFLWRKLLDLRFEKCQLKSELSWWSPVYTPVLEHCCTADGEPATQ